MKCSKCGEVKTDYHFFSFRGNYIKEFFANPLTLNGQCFDCNAPYKCLCCGVIQDSDQFRVQGRICKTCKDSGILRPSRVAYAISDEVWRGYTSDSLKTLESGFSNE